MAGVEVLVANANGNPIVYIDRSSTPGIIIVSSNLDAFCHTFYDIDPAKRFLSNLLDWAEREAELLGRAVQKAPRIGAIYSGQGFQYELLTSDEFGPLLDIIYVSRLPLVDLMQFEVLLVLRESNQEMLKLSGDKLVQFLNSGRIIISFGEVTVDWLPGFNWFRHRVDEKSLRFVRPEHPFLEGLELSDVQWHCHGSFRAPSEADVLIKDGEGQDILFIDKRRFRGKLLATTLDPDVHVGFGSGLTKKFLWNSLRWAIREAETAGLVD